MKKIIILLALCLFLISCGSRKVNRTLEENKTKEIVKETETKTEDKEVRKDVVIINNNDEITITPVDNKTPMIIDGKEYVNAVIVQKKIKDILIDKTVEKAHTKALKQAYKVKEIEVKKKAVEIERKASFFWLLWLLLLIPIYYLWKNRKMFGIVI